LGKEQSNNKENVMTKAGVVIICALICCALWGSAVPCIKIGYAIEGISSSDTADQLLFAGVRFFVAGILVVIIGSITAGHILLPVSTGTSKNNISSPRQPENDLIKSDSVRQTMNNRTESESVRQTISERNAAVPRTTSGESRGPGSDRAPRSRIGKIVVLALFQTIGQYIFFYIGVANSAGVKSSILTCTNVFFSLILAGLVFRQEKITGRKTLGCIIGFIGVILVNLGGAGEYAAGFRLIGEGFVMLSALCGSFAAGFIKKFSRDEDPVLMSGWQFVIGGLVLSLIGAGMGGRLTVITPGFCLLLFYMACISAVAYTLWGVLLKYNPVSRITVFCFSTPIIGVTLSALLLNEGSFLTVWCLSALVLVCIGIWLVNKE